MRKIYITLMTVVSASVLSINSASAQDEKMQVVTEQQDSTHENSTEKEAVPKKEVVKTSSLGVVVGSSGIGLEYTSPLSKRFNLRAGFGYIPKLTYSNNGILSSEKVNNEFTTKLFQMHFFGDWFAFGPNFHFTGGIAAFIGAKSKVITTPVGEYYYGEIDLNDDPERMGNMTSTVNSSCMAVYLGLGWQNIINTKHFGLSLDLGTYYALVSPQVTIETSGYLIGNESNRKQLQDNLDNYRWLPNLQLGFNYKF